MEKKKFVVIARRWFERVNGNTYHTFKIIDGDTGKEYYRPQMYSGYGEHYKQNAFELMKQEGLINTNEGIFYFTWERENDYPVIWEVTDVKTKKEMMRLIPDYNPTVDHKRVKSRGAK